jgi:4-amino-4-deoxy-L-arabinose transferase-like glycosyltransferase
MKKIFFMSKALLVSNIIFIVLSIFLFRKVSVHESHCEIDSSAYLKSATNFYNNKFFEKKDSFPHYALGYSIIIGMLYKIFKPRKEVIIYYQIALALLSNIVLFYLAFIFFGSLAASLCSLFFSINLGYLVFSQFILTEITLSFFLLLFFYCFVVFIKTSSVRYLYFSMAFLGTSILIKQAAIYFVAIFLFFIVNKLRRNYKPIIISLLCFYFPVGVYMTYNKMIFGHFSTGNFKNINMLYWYLPKILGHIQKRNHVAIRAELQEKEIEEVQGIFWETVTKRPFTSMYVWMKNVAQTFLGFYSTSIKRLILGCRKFNAVPFFLIVGNWIQKISMYLKQGALNKWLYSVSIYELCWMIFSYSCAFFCCFYLFLKRKFELLLFILAYIFYFSIITGHDGTARFRMLFEFVLLLLTSGGSAIFLKMVFCTNKKKLIIFVWQLLFSDKRENSK